MIEQYGKTSTVSYTRSICSLISFPIPFINTNYNLNVCSDSSINSTTDFHTSFIGSKNKSASDAYIAVYGYGTSDTSQFIKWKATGF